MADLTVVRRDDQYLNIPILDENGAAVDLSAAAAIWFVLADAKGGTVLATRTKAGGDVTVTGSSSNNVRVHLLPADTAAGLTPFSVWWYELQVKEAAGRISTPAKGTIRVDADTQVATS